MTKQEMQKIRDNAIEDGHINSSLAILLLDELEESIAVFEPLKYHDNSLLLAKAHKLKGTDGEGWSIGDVVERYVTLSGGAVDVGVD